MALVRPVFVVVRQELAQYGEQVPGVVDQALHENADLAAGYERVLVLSPFDGRTRTPLEWGMRLAAQVDELRTRGIWR